MNKRCTDKYVDEIRAREKAATPGPWTLLRDGSIERICDANGGCNNG